MESEILIAPPFDLGKSEVRHTGAQKKDWLIWPEIVDESIRGMSCIWAISQRLAGSLPGGQSEVGIDSRYIEW